MEVPIHPSIQAKHYRIIVMGHLDTQWSDWFDGLTIAPQPNGTTILCGVIVDQSALYGLIARLRDLGITLLALERTAETE